VNRIHAIENVLTRPRDVNDRPGIQSARGKRVVSRSADIIHYTRIDGDWRVGQRTELAPVAKRNRIPH
jgi:hypothetical protein